MPKTKEEWFESFNLEGLTNVQRDYNNNRYKDFDNPEVHNYAKEWISIQLEKKKSVRRSRKPPYEIAAWIFGSLILIFLISAFFYTPCLTSDQRGILRFLMALAGALFAFFFVGGVVLEGKLKDLAISAAGGAAIFILIQFIFNPFPEKDCIVTTTTNTNTQPSNSGNVNTNSVNVNNSTIAQGDVVTKTLEERNEGLTSNTNNENTSVPSNNQKSTTTANNQKSTNGNISITPDNKNTIENISSNNQNTNTSQPRTVKLIVKITVMKKDNTTNQKIDVTSTSKVRVKLKNQSGQVNDTKIGTTVEFKDVPCGQFIYLEVSDNNKKHEIYEYLPPCSSNTHEISRIFDAG